MGIPGAAVILRLREDEPFESEDSDWPADRPPSQTLLRVRGDRNLRNLLPFRFTVRSGSDGERSVKRKVLLPGVFEDGSQGGLGIVAILPGTGQVRTGLRRSPIRDVGRPWEGRDRP